MLKNVLSNIRVYSVVTVQGKAGLNSNADRGWAGAGNRQAQVSTKMPRGRTGTEQQGT